MISLSEMIRDFGNKISAGRSITFLGTGLISQENKDRKGAALFITYRSNKYLIDIPPDLDLSVEPDYLLISYLDTEAVGGIKELYKTKLTIGLPKNFEDKMDIKKGWNKKVLRPDRDNNIGDLQITPFEVIHDVIGHKACFGYRISFPDEFIVLYAPNIVSIPEKTEQYFEKSDILIVDGAGWNADLPTHFGMWSFLDLVQEKKWDIKKIFFTQISSMIPEDAQKQLSDRYPKIKAIIPKDNLKINF